MKTLARNFVASALAILSRGILRKYRPIVVMVTGSVGKTSTKDAVAAALGEHFLVRKSEKSYNSEFGVPLTIIGAKNPWTNVVRWLKVFQEGLALLMLPNHFPKLLVLEVGADRPGDLAKILRIATPDVVVVTKLPDVPVHVEAYATPQAVREEEFAPAYALNPGAALIISSDDPHALSMATPLPVSITTYGYAEGADLQIRNARLAEGMEGEVAIEGKHYTLRAPGALGKQQLYAPAAALAVARALHVPVAQALSGLKKYTPPPGRARILSGRNGSVLVDDTYNASPAAVEEALNALSLVPGSRRIAVLGDMLELGRYSAEEHTRIGAVAAKTCDLVVSVGTRARAIAEGARKGGLADTQVLEFSDSKGAAEALKEVVREGDVVLVKGSQSIRTERVTEALLQRPEDLEKLVRQDKEWKRR
ncbi:MAG TPA: UDP-N-acetylmuramoyl-tripeptide--D-alanyl-D-alanine ligase [Candidatus Paceibacterota bacterium]|nr:UDP-N-acetylmuramoyl-tripeptide--D-alanyl-D-alanine ligase [Candidatus Paceibacterota bacterium]